MVLDIFATNGTVHATVAGIGLLCLLPKGARSTTVIGNKILKCFNVIVDNQQGFMYLKPNSFFQKKDKGAYFGTKLFIIGQASQ
jgi:hypothetical protein